MRKVVSLGVILLGCVLVQLPAHIADQVLAIDMFFMVREPEPFLRELKRFKLLILPFCYSLSKEAFGLIREAVDAGAMLVR